MIETPFGNIHGIDDETITMLDLLNLFKAIEEGMVHQITYREDTKPYKSRSFDISKVVRCKDCRHGKQRNVNIICCQKPHAFCSFNYEYHNSEWFCPDGEQKEGEH